MTDDSECTIRDLINWWEFWWTRGSTAWLQTQSSNRYDKSLISDGSVTKLSHRSDSIQDIDYIATPIQGFLLQKLKIQNDETVEILFH